MLATKQNKNFADMVRALLVILLTALLFLIVAGSDESVIEMLDETWAADFFHALHIGNSIVFGLAISFFTSVISWMVFVYFPEQKRKRIAKKRLSKSYKHFKESVIGNLLGILEAQGSDIPPKNLMMHGWILICLLWR